MPEILYDANTLMTRGYPEIQKLGACSPNGEMTPFVWQGRLMRMELLDPSKGTDVSIERCAGIRDVESGKIISKLAQDSYFHSAYVEGDTAYVLGVDMKRRDTIRIYESKDLIHWTDRDLLTNPGWIYFNTGLTKGPDGYALVLESGPWAYPNLADTDYPKKYMGSYGWTLFFATSPDLKEWKFLDYEQAFSKDYGTGGPHLKYSDGWFYLGADVVLPRKIFSHYLYRTKDFENWYVGYYNPVMMPSNDDKKISPNAADIDEEMAERLKTAFNVNNTDLDMCDWNGKTYINYLCGNQLGNYWMCDAICDMPMAEFLKSYFE